MKCNMEYQVLEVKFAYGVEQKTIICYTLPDMPLIAQCLCGSLSLNASSITCSSP